jgi:hypothetical protein
MPKSTGGGALHLVNRPKDLTFRENGFSRSGYFEVLRRRSGGTLSQAFGGKVRPEPVFLRQFCTNCKLCTAFCRKSGISDV